MENDITRKIDTLVEMSESTLNVDTANAELQEIDSRVIFLNTESDLLNEEGKKEKQTEFAKNLLDVLDIETISKKTVLSITEIKKLF